MRETIIDNELLKNEIKALNNYVNRDEYNLNVVATMVDEIQNIIAGLKAYDKVCQVKKPFNKADEILKILKPRITLKEDVLTSDMPIFSNYNEITSEKKSNQRSNRYGIRGI